VVSAVAVKMAVEALGGRLRADGAELVVVAPKGRLGPELAAELRERKRQVLALLAGECCRYCEGAVEWRRPGGVTFADGTVAHLGCYDEAEVARLRAAARRAVARPDALADEAEVMLRGGPLP
jgi:TubC N-terminal docking domain